MRYRINMAHSISHIVMNFKNASYCLVEFHNLTLVWEIFYLLYSNQNQSVAQKNNGIEENSENTSSSVTILIEKILEASGTNREEDI